MNRDLTLVIPVINEGDILKENTRKLKEFMDSLSVDYEIIICSNGSTDDTLRVGEKLRGDRLRFFHLKDRGVGLAFRKMVEEAASEKIVSVDMDLSIDLDFIPKAYELLDECGVVVGSKKMGEQERSFFRLLASNIFIYLVRLLMGLDYRDYSIAAKGYRRSDILKHLSLIDHGSSYVVELIYHVKEGGGQIIEVPVSCHDTRKSKFNIYDESIYRLKNLLTLWFRERLTKSI
ncbi:MAG: glycosyltransferase family 2 protein [Candidatus Altiarchaeota archaeon]|nr:glycosyltransferase family 2 protein [Candidatus Altiarchaeota archaeon]